MIRLVFGTDDRNSVGFVNPEDMPKRLEAWPEGTQEEIGKVFFGESVVVGSKTYAPFYGEYETDENKVYVLSRSENFDLKGNKSAELVNDYMKIVEKFKDSDDVLIVAGGKMTWELFLTYAKEMKVLYFEKELPGDIIFDSWRDIKKTAVSSEKWSGGTTTLYKIEK